MEKKFIDREYLLLQYQAFLDATKVHLTGALPDLNLAKFKDEVTGEERDKVLVEAINEIILYLSKSLAIEGVTYAEWSATDIKDQLVDTDAKVVTKFYRITDDFTYGDGETLGDGKFYQAGTIIYASTYHIDPNDADPDNADIAHDYYYDWQVLASEAGLIGDFFNGQTIADVQTDPATPVLATTVTEALDMLDKKIGDMLTLNLQLGDDTFPISRTLVDAINELVRYLQKLDTITEVTYAQWSQNAVKYQEADNTEKFIYKAYRITDEFTLTDGTYYPAGSVIYAIETEDITSPVTRTVFKWQYLPIDPRTGNFALLDERLVKGKDGEDTTPKSIVEGINHAMTDLTITLEVADEATEGYLKTYEIYQGTDEDTRVKVGVIDIPKDMVITRSEVITATGNEVTGKDADGFDITDLEADKRYLVLYIANQDYPVYINVEDFIQLYQPEEDAAQIQITIDQHNIISAVVVEDSITHTELDKPTERELDFVGFDHDLVNADTGAMIAPQLTTTAQTLREAVNELDEKQGDDMLTTFAQDISAAINEHDQEIGDLNNLTTTYKANLVGAINEHDSEIGNLPELTTTEKGTLVGAIDELDSDIGNLADLTTTEKTSLVLAINELDAKQGDDPLSTVKKDLSGAVNELDGELGDLANLNAKLQAEDTADDGIKTMVKAANLALSRSLVTAEKDTTDPAITYKYVFKQDDRTIIEVELPLDIRVNAGNIFKAVGTEIIGSDAAGGNVLAEAGKHYLRLQFANSTEEVFILVETLFNTAEQNAQQIQLVIDNDQVISATIVPGSVTLTELDAILNSAYTFLDPTTPLTTTAQTVVTAINEHDTEIGDLATLKTGEKNSLVGATNELVDDLAQQALDILERLHLVAAVPYADFQSGYLNNALAEPNSCVIITTQFEIGETEYKPGTWAYLFRHADGTKEWRYMNNGGGGEKIYIDLGTNPLPESSTMSQIAAIKTNAIYVTTTDEGNKNCYIFLKRSDNDPAQNSWLLVSSDSKGIEWIGSYNYMATETIIDPDTGASTTQTNEWKGTPEQMTLISQWVQQTYGRQPEMNDLVTLTVDRAYFGQFLYKNNQWQEYSSLTKATKAQYGVTMFATMDQYDQGLTNIAIDPWLLKQLLADVASDAYTKAQTDALLLDKVGYSYLADQYYDKDTTDTKLKSIQKAFILNENPETMSAVNLEKYYGSLVYYRDVAAGTTTTYIVDSTGVIENLGESGVSLDGYVSTSNPKWLTLSDVRLTDDKGNPQTVQQQLDKKLDAITGAATTIVKDDLIVNRALVSNSNGKVAASTITANELKMLAGINTTDPTNKTIELRLQALEAGGTGTSTATNAITIVDSLPTTGINVYTIYRLKTDSGGYPYGYYVYNATEWLRLDNLGGLLEVASLPMAGVPNILYKRVTDLSLWMYTNGTWTKINGAAGGAITAYINGVQLSGDNQTSEDLKIIKTLTLAEYNALTVAEQMNGTIYLITDDNTGGAAMSPDGSIVTVQNTLTSTSTTDALSAYQGYALNSRVTTLEQKVIPTIANDLTTSSATSALSAEQGVVLKKAIDDLKKDVGNVKTNIVNDLDTTATGSALDASQGNVLAGRIKTLTSTVEGFNTRIENIENRLDTIEQSLAALFTYDSANKLLTINSI